MHACSAFILFIYLFFVFVFVLYIILAVISLKCLLMCQNLKFSFYNALSSDVLVLCFYRGLSANRLYKQGYHTGGTQELQQLAVNTYWRGSAGTTAQLPYPAPDSEKTAENAGYIPNGTFTATDASRLQDYYAQGNNPLFTPFSGMNSFPNMPPKSSYPPPPPYESHSQICSTQSSYEREEKMTERQNYWSGGKEEDYEQPSKRLRISSSVDLSSPSE